jgi:hypothetical protein
MKRTLLLLAAFAFAAPVTAADSSSCLVQLVDVGERPMARLPVEALVLADGRIARIPAVTDRKGVAEFDWSGSAVQAVVMHQQSELGACLNGKPRRLRVTR